MRRRLERGVGRLVGEVLLAGEEAQAINKNARRCCVSWFACCPKTRRAAWDSGPRASPRCLQRGTKWGTNAEACLSLGQLRGNYLPALRPFLTNQSHANLLGLRPAASVDDAHEDACITKDPHICHTRSRPSKPAGPGAFWNDVPFVEQTAIKTAANEIVRDDPPQRSNIAFGVGCELVAFHLRYLIFWFGVRPHGLLLRRTISHTNPSEQSDTDDRSCVRHKFPPVPT